MKAGRATRKCNRKEIKCSLSTTQKLVEVLWKHLSHTKLSSQGPKWRWRGGGVSFHPFHTQISITNFRWQICHRSNFLFVFSELLIITALYFFKMYLTGLHSSSQHPIVSAHPGSFQDCLCEPKCSFELHGRGPLWNRPTWVRTSVCQGWKSWEVLANRRPA